MNSNVAIKLKNISKYFSGIPANKNINLTINHGEILAILGENGSGKTTLMNMIAGIYFPDEGQIEIDGEEVVIASPRDAFKYKIGMVHQHFKLVDVFSATENVVLGLEDKYDLKNATTTINEISHKYGFDIDFNKKVYEMSVSEKQTVEIIKVLYRGAEILILDEPTAVLTPQETQKLFAILKKMREAGKSIIIITHKLHEVLSISDRVAVLRKGEYVGSVNTRETNELELTEMMVGEKIVLNINRTEPKNQEERLIVKNLDCINRDGIKVLDDVSFTIKKGETLGILGSTGSGKSTLMYLLDRLYEPTKGKITIGGVDIATIKKDHLRENIGFVLQEPFLFSRSLSENIAIAKKEATHQDVIEASRIASLDDAVSHFTKGYDTFVGERGVTLSGGQKQRTAIAQMIISKTPIMIFDDSLSAVDTQTDQKIRKALKENVHDSTVIMISHRISTLKDADHIIVMNEGKIIEEGTHQSLMNQNGLYKTISDIQSLGGISHE